VRCRPQHVDPVVDFLEGVQAQFHTSSHIDGSAPCPSTSAITASVPRLAVMQMHIRAKEKGLLGIHETHLNAASVSIQEETLLDVVSMRRTHGVQNSASILRTRRRARLVNMS